MSIPIPSEDIEGLLPPDTTTSTTAAEGDTTESTVEETQRAGILEEVETEIGLLEQASEGEMAGFFITAG